MAEAGQQAEDGDRSVEIQSGGEADRGQQREEFGWAGFAGRSSIALRVSGARSWVFRDIDVDRFLLCSEEFDELF